MTHCFDIYAQLSEIGSQLRQDIEMDSEGVTLNETSEDL